MNQKSKNYFISMKDGFVLLDAVISIFIISLFIVSVVSFYSVIINKLNTQDEGLRTYFEKYNTFIEEQEIIFNEE